MPNNAELDPKTTEAINAALNNDWQKALSLNRELLKNYPNDIDTMNRLARALCETGNLSEAKKTYQKVLKIDPYNQIADKNLKRISSIKNWASNENGNRPNYSLKGDLFLEEPGKTTVSTLEDTALPALLADLRTGDELTLVIHKTQTTVVSKNGKRLGKLDSETSSILYTHAKLGSKFSAFVKAVSFPARNGANEKPKVEIFIREEKRGSKVTQSPFPSTSPSFTPYVREETLNILSNQAPLQAESDEGIEEIEVSELSSIEREASLEELAEKEIEEDHDNE